ncbi:dermokine-like [Aplysia californica]|uniref:Dermokine-like n=1 Tax=Aplysia californica TaxID=6500 RepID=A0ABM0JYX8_APLCA|nr:dermokine-like [Aplysia californica]
MRSVNNDQLAALNPALGDATAKANSAPDLASADIVDAPVPEGGGTNGPGTLPSSTSHPAHLDELHKGSCSQSGVKNTSIVTADINIVGGAKFDDVGSSNVSKDASATNDSSAGAGPDNSCQSRHSESNDSGFGSERKHSQGNDGGFHASASAGNHSNSGGGGAAVAGGDNKGKRHSQPSSGNTRTTSVVSSSDVTLQNHVMSTVDLGDDVLAPVTEV